MFLELLKKRRSIRQFAAKKVEQHKIDTLVEAMLRSPSSRSLNPWEFIVVTDEGTIERLSDAKAHGSRFMKNAPLAIVVCADPAKSDVWIEDTSIASIILHLSATDLDLGSCWVQIRNREHDAATSAEEVVRQQLDIPDNLVVEAIVAIGYPAEEKPGHQMSSLLFERVYYQKYGRKEQEGN